MTNSNGNANDVDGLVMTLMEKFQESVKGLVTQAVNDGARIGGEEARKHLVAQLTSTPMHVANDVPAKRDRTLKGTVKCPVNTCRLPGSRQLHCFCRKHFQMLPVEKRESLRDLQIQQQQKDKDTALEKVMARKRRAA